MLVKYFLDIITPRGTIYRAPTARIEHFNFENLGLKMPDRFHPSRKHIRLPDFDYTLPGDYFVTVVTRDRAQIFGRIFDSRMELNDFGQVVGEEWHKTAILRPEIDLGPFVVMPNHIHGIIRITDLNPHNHMNAVGSRRAVTLPQSGILNNNGNAPIGFDENIERFGKPIAGSIPTIVRAFKSAVTKRINEIRATPGLPIWQRNYFEHIIRTDKEFQEVESYILNNPLNWLSDEEYT